METVGLTRRILALLYDSLIVVGIALSLSLVLVWLNGGAGPPGSFVSYLQIAIIIFIGPFFYSYFWIKNNGQTLGMQAWKIKLISSNNLPLTLRQVLLRCLLSTLSALLLGLGYLWILVNKENLSWADILTNTKVVRINPLSSKL